MKTSSFLGTAEARADHLRELSHHLRSLDWTSASLGEAEHEIPELELAITVYRRLSPEGADTSAGGDPDVFLNTAEGRVEHLRQLGDHMRALDWVQASLTEVENEIPELEVAITVYRRLTGETDSGLRSSANADAGPPEKRSGARSPREDEDAQTDFAPSFSQFAVQHLELAKPAAETAADPNGTQ
jgi:hypothetical protein